MEMNQVYNLVNQVTSEVLGETAVLNEDLSNTVDIGDAVINQNAKDSYVRSLVAHIGKMIFVNRVYRGSVPSVLMDGWEFGSILEKVSSEMPEAEENETWELEDRESYDPNVFYKPTVEAKFYNKRVTFEIPRSITERQVKMSFSNATQLNAFISMLYNEVEKSLTVKIDELIMRTINNMTAETIHSEYATAALNSKSGIRAVNLLYLYNQKVGQGNEIIAEQSVTDMNFLKFASFTMANYIDRLRKISTLFNVGGKARFTPTDMLHVVMLSDFKNAADFYLQSDTFHDKYTALPNSETVPYWQGSGTSYDFDSITAINVKDSSGDTVAADGILAVMFDRDALGVANLERRVTTNYNPKAEFYNNFYKFEAGYFNDLNENFVVFFVK